MEVVSRVPDARSIPLRRLAKAPQDPEPELESLPVAAFQSSI